MLLPLAIRSTRLSPALSPTLPAWLHCLPLCFIPLRSLAQQVNIHMSQRLILERGSLPLAKAFFATPSNSLHVGGR